MKQLITLILLCISFAAGAQAKRQHRIDSMRIVLSGAKDDTAKVQLLLKVGNALKETSLDDMLLYSNQAMELAVKLNDKKGMAGAYRNIGVVHYTRAEYNLALKNYRKGLELNRELGDRQNEGAALCNIGAVYLDISYFNKAMENFNEAKAILQKIDYKPFLAKTITNIGALHLRKAEYSDAIDCYKQALELYTATDNKRGMADACNGLSLLYAKKHEYKMAEDAAIQALGYAGEVKYQGGINYAHRQLDEIRAVNNEKK